VREREDQYCQDPYCDGASPAGYSHLPTECNAQPWLPDEVDAVLVAAWQRGVRSPWQMAIEALKTVYPEDVETGRPLSWPSTSFDCAEARCLEHRVRTRAHRVHATLEDEQVDSEWYESGGY
jgi:hypothetical protein